jgi:hypothetical protein
MQGLATEAGVTVGLTKPRFELVARPVEVVGWKKAVTVPLHFSRRRQLQHLTAGLLRASTLHEVREDKMLVAWAEGVS